MSTAGPPLVPTTKIRRTEKPSSPKARLSLAADQRRRGWEWRGLPRPEADGRLLRQRCGKIGQPCRRLEEGGVVDAADHEHGRRPAPRPETSSSREPPEATWAEGPAQRLQLAVGPHQHGGDRGALRQPGKGGLQCPLQIGEAALRGPDPNLGDPHWPLGAVAARRSPRPPGPPTGGVPDAGRCRR